MRGWHGHAREEEACPAAVSDERGSFTMVRWQLDPLVLQWLQAAPYWAGLADNIGQSRKRAKSCLAPSEHAWKHEDGGFTGARPPNPATLNKRHSPPPPPARVANVPQIISTFVVFRARLFSLHLYHSPPTASHLLSRTRSQ